MGILYYLGCYVFGFLLITLIYHKIEESDDPPFNKVLVALAWGLSPISFPVILTILVILTLGAVMLDTAKWLNEKIGQISITFKK